MEELSNFSFINNKKYSIYISREFLCITEKVNKNYINKYEFVLGGNKYRINYNSIISDNIYHYISLNNFCLNNTVCINIYKDDNKIFSLRLPKHQIENFLFFPIAPFSFQFKYFFNPFNPVYFHREYYVKKYNNINFREINPFIHYLSSGYYENKFPNMAAEDKLDLKFYIESNKDINFYTMNPLLHYINHGKKEGRPPNIEDENYLDPYHFYVSNNDFISSYIYKVLSHSTYFDSIFYKKTYNLDSGIDPVSHYMDFGVHHGYVTSKYFSPFCYLIRHCSNFEYNINPIFHCETSKHIKNPAINVRHHHEILDKNNSDLNEIKRIQDNYLNDKYNINAIKDLVIFLVPEKNIINGGILSIFTLAKESTEILSNKTVLIMTVPQSRTYYKNTNIEHKGIVLRFSQIIKFIFAEQILIHIPEFFVKHFIEFLSVEEIIFLNKVKDLRFNILNQNQTYLPRYSVIKILKLFTKNITMTCSHERFITKQLSDCYQLQTFYLPTSNLIEYYNEKYENKKDILVYSSDFHILKDKIIKRISKHFPTLKLIEIKNLKYRDYLDLLTTAKWVITFGEGFDGYFTEGFRSGAISFSVNNNIFFPKEFSKFPNIYPSYLDMYNNIVNDMVNLDNKNSFKSLNSKLIKAYNKHKNDKLHYNKLKEFYYSIFPPKNDNITYFIDHKKSPLISILMSTYNGEQYIDKQIESLLDLKYENTEIIIADDMSTDNTFNILKKYRKFAKLKIYKNNKQFGFPMSFINLFYKSKGEYICFCDQDDYWVNNRIEKFLDHINGFDAIFGRVSIIDNNCNFHKNKIMHNHYSRNKFYINSIIDFIDTSPLLGMASMFTRKIIQKSLPFPINHFFYHDWWFAINSILVGNGICYFDDNVTFYRQHDKNKAKHDFDDADYYNKIITKQISYVLKRFHRKLNQFERNTLTTNLKYYKLSSLFDIHNNKDKGFISYIRDNKEILNILIN